MNLKLNKCPDCGSDRIHIETGDFGEPDGRLVRNLERWVCPDCAAIFYDVSAMRRIEDAKTAGRKDAKILAISK